MKAATAQEIKQELKKHSVSELMEICLRLSRFKKENKELLTYLLFEEDDLETYIGNVKEEMDEHFRLINVSHIYFAKKTLRKILRIANKHIRYTGSKTAEVELLLHYCRRFRELNLPLLKSTALKKLYDTQIKKITTVIGSMHEDLQFDYLREIDKLTS